MQIEKIAREFFLDTIRQAREENYEAVFNALKELELIAHSEEEVMQIYHITANRSEAKDICSSLRSILDDEYFPGAYYYAWKFYLWYTAAEIAKILDMKPKKHYSGFVNFFLAMSIENNYSKSDQTDEDELQTFIDTHNFVKLLGEPSMNVYREGSADRFFKEFQVKKNLIK